MGVYSTFQSGFQGDIISSQIVLKTLDKKTYAIPGITCHPGLSVSFNGETAYYWKTSASNILDGHIGSKVTFAAAGGNTNHINIVNSINVADEITSAEMQLIEGVDMIQERIAKAALSISNKYNEKFITALEGVITATREADKTWDISDDGAWSATNVYTRLISAIQGFKVKNKASGIKPTALIVSNQVISALKEKNLLTYKEAMPDETELIEGYFGKIPVIECLDFTTGFDVIVMNAEGLAAPKNINNLLIAQGEAATAVGLPGGARIAGQLGYAFAVTEDDFFYVVKEQE